MTEHPIPLSEALAPYGQRVADRKKGAVEPVTETVPGYVGSRTWTRWGGEPDDPAPTVYLEDGEISVGEAALSIDAAEVYALRILAAVHHERLAIQRQADADLLASAFGNGATHDWDTSHSGMAQCRRCPTHATDPPIRHGAVPAGPPDERCRQQSWHEVASMPGEPESGQCIFCLTVYPPTADLERTQ